MDGESAAGTCSIPKDKLDNFESAFSSHSAGFERRCECGQIFFDSYNTGYDLCEGEFDQLEANPKATSVRHGVETIIVDGREFCMDCNCWHDRAARIIDWMDEHADAIVEWMKLERKRKTAEALRSPVVD